MSSAISEVEPLAVVSRDAGLAREMPADVGDDSLAHPDGVDHLTGELRAELADHEHVDRVLQVGKRLLGRWRDRGLRRDETLVELHDCYFLLRRNKPRRPLDEPTASGSLTGVSSVKSAASS